MTCERTLCSFCAIHSKRSSNINGCHGCATTHRRASIYNCECIKATIIKVIIQIRPILVNHCAFGVSATPSATIAPRRATHLLNSLCNTLIREEYTSINLGILVLRELLIRNRLRLSLHALKVVARKCVTINKTSSRRNLIKLNSIPSIGRHKSFKYVNTFTQLRKSLTILSRGQAKALACLGTERTRVSRRGIFRLKPFREKANSTVLSTQRRNIQSKLMLHKGKSIFLQLSSDKLIKVIPSAVFRNILEITLCCFWLIICQPVITYAEETSLTSTTAAITNIKQTLHSKRLIFVKSILKQKNTIIFASGTIRGSKSKHIVYSRASGIMLNASIFGISPISVLLETI